MKSGRPGKGSGLAKFRQKFPKAFTAVIDFERAKQILEMESLDPLRNDLSLLQRSNPLPA